MAIIRAWILGVLLAVLLVSALAVIYSKYQSRLVFIEIQKQEKTLDKYAVEWGQYQVELMMLTEQNQIEQKAVEKLKLIMPPHENIIYIKP
ncbi:MAG: cell division protein FtsL [Methylococcaceae bacterium]